MKKLILLIAAVAMLLPSCKKINEAIDDLNNRVTELENTTIPTINEQIANINTSIADLEAADIELKNYITALQNTAAELQKSIDAANTKIDEVKVALQSEISTAKADVLAQLEALRTEMTNELSQINSTIATLQAKDTELEGKIAELRTYVDTELKNTKDWATATFSTLEQYNALCTEIATIKTQIENLNRSISELETRLNTKIATDIAAAVKGLQGELAEAVTEITNSYTSAISTAKEEITAAYTAAIQSAISALESSMKQWVGEQLANYYTIAESEAKLAVLKADLEAQLAVQKTYCESLMTALTNNMTSQVENLQKQIDAINKTIADINKEIEALYSKLEQTKAEITTAYTEAIAKAIEENEGKWSDALAKEVEALNELIEKNNIVAFDAFAEEATSRIEALEADIANILSEIEDIKEDIANLLARIQSVSYVPKYSDGNATMDYGTKTAEFDFLISPKSAVAELAKVWNSALSVKAVYTQTRAVEFINLPITEFVADNNNGVISIKVSGTNLSDAFYTDQQDAKAMLQISDGNSSLTSEYISMTPNFNIQFEDLRVKAICCKNWDTNNDGELSYEEAAAVMDIGTVFKEDVNIIAFTELKYFTGITEIPDNAFNGCTVLWKIVLPENVQTIGDSAFYHCKGISNIDLPNKVTTIDSKAFYNCDALSNIVFSESLNTIGDLAFYDCDSLKYLIFGNSVSSIGKYAFYSCSSLISLKIGRNVSLIDVAAFYKCGSLASVYCAPTIPPAIHYGRYVAYDESNASRQGGGTFPFNSEMKIYVPRGSYNSYMQYSDYTGDYSSAQTNWYKYESYIEPYDF